MKSISAILLLVLLLTCTAATAQTGDVTCQDAINSINKCSVNLINEQYPNIDMQAHDIP